jgi:hypothetical protein
MRRASFRCRRRTAAPETGVLDRFHSRHLHPHPVAIELTAIERRARRSLWLLDEAVSELAPSARLVYPTAPRRTRLTKAERE